MTDDAKCPDKGKTPTDRCKSMSKCDGTVVVEVRRVGNGKTETLLASAHPAIVGAVYQACLELLGLTEDYEVTQEVLGESGQGLKAVQEIYNAGRHEAT